MREPILSGLLYLGRLAGIVPPGFRRAARVAGLGWWTTKGIPIGDPMRRLVPLGNPIAPGADQPVQRTAGDGELGPRLRRDDAFDHGVDRGARHARQVL